MKIGVIGCGNMGGGMVNALSGAGMDATAYDANVDSLARMEALGVRIVDSAQALAKMVDLLILSLPNASTVEAVMAEVYPHLQQGAVVLDTSTSVPATSQAMSTLGIEQGFAFIDGPVSGGPAAANAGSMTMLLAGDETAIDSIQVVLDVLTAKTVYLGHSGSGHAAKIANNMLCAANLVLVAEAVRLGEAAGIKAEDLLAGINAGSGRSGVSEVNFPKWVLSNTFDSGFTMGLMRKDVGLALDLAKKSDVPLVGFQSIADIWLHSSEQIDNQEDFNKITTQISKG